MTMRRQVATVHSSPVLRLERPGGAGEVMGGLRRLHQEEAFADVELVGGGGGARRHPRRAHGLVLGATSELLRGWLAEAAPTPAAGAQYTILVPDVGSTELGLLLDILYGRELALPSSLVSKVNDAADLLGISVDLPYKTIVSSSSGIQGHQQANTPPPLCCWHCNVAFRDLGELKVHIQSHQGEQFKKKLHKCQQCKKVLPSMWRLRQHLLTHKAGSKPTIPTQPKISQQNVQILLQASSSQPVTPPKRLTTIAASSTDDHPYATASDPLQTTPEVAPAVVVQAKSDHLYSSTKTKENREAETQQELQVRLKKIDHLYSCPSSPSSAANTASSKAKKVKKQSIQALGHSYAAARPRRVSATENVKKRSVRLTDSSMFPCEQCDKEFELPHRLNRHVREVHSSRRMFPCDRCDKEFSQPYRLNRHIREVHIKEKLHACAYCDKSFFKVTSRERHELTHTEHQLWKCSSCSKCFRDPSSLKYHEAKSVCQKKSQKSKALQGD